MKCAFLLFFIVFIGSKINAQQFRYYEWHPSHYKGLKLAKEQKIQFRIMGVNHCKDYDSLKVNYENKVNKLKEIKSEEHYNLRRIFLLKIDSLEAIFENQIVENLNENQRNIFLKKLELRTKQKANSPNYRF